MFLDEATIRVRGGRGGNGLSHFLSTRLSPRGGPDGGTGGDGGSVILQATGSLSTLHSFRNRPRFDAGDGGDGGKDGRHGSRGEDRIVPVPVGTVVRDAETGRVLADLAEACDEMVVAEGGEAGRGNASFVTSLRQAPWVCERGLPGEDRDLRLELKLIADVGIIGYPNVGKSSLIARISAARPKVADYPFTTIVPNLGVVDVDGARQFVAVDIPGLIEGAHDGKGLGDRFLRHVERTALFIHLIDLAAEGEGRDPIDDYRQIQEELRSFNAELVDRPQVVAGNKIDLLQEDAVDRAIRRFAEIGVAFLPISVATGAGVRDLVLRVFHRLEEARATKAATGVTTRRKVYRMSPEAGFRVERNGEGFVVRGEGVEKIVQKLILNSRDALEYLTDRLEKMGVLKELRRQGFSDGDTVRIGEVDFELEG